MMSQEAAWCAGTLGCLGAWVKEGVLNAPWELRLHGTREPCTSAKNPGGTNINGLSRWQTVFLIFLSIRVFGHKKVAVYKSSWP